MRIDEGAIKKRKEYCNINLDNEDLLSLEDRYTGAVNKWNKFKQKELQDKEDNLLNLYPSEIVGDSGEINKH